ncbi:MAG: DNA repair protein RadA [Cytophagales bacterium]|nr:MAG: DNA repair protein RadA [Cytophagales bacterium]
MAKVKSSYFCQSCGYQSVKWQGKCPSCGAWNSFVEELIQKEEPQQGSWKTSSSKQIATKPIEIKDIQSDTQERYKTIDNELNRVLGGGIVAGSLILIGGEPGIGKSTLMLQISLSFIDKKVLYISGEESDSQIKMRAERINLSENISMKDSNCFILTETNTQNIFKQIEILEPEIVIVDSIQTMCSTFIESSAGSISQVRECTAEFMKYAKETGTPVFLIGHITKEGTLAGPKVLEHMVDTVLQFEGDRHMTYRILRTTKNRFGSTSELGIYEMHTQGLREVSNPSEILISQKDTDLSGVSIAAMIEGNRPLLIEIQSLVSPAAYGNPQRSSTGFDAKRMNMLLAVLEKRGGFRLGQQDVFLNITGGIRVDDPAIDLAVCVSIVSSYNDMSIPQHCCFAAEIGLGGEVRAVNRTEQRISEAEKLGFKQIFVSKFAMKGIEIKNYGIKIAPISKLDDVFSELFG